MDGIISSTAMNRGSELIAKFFEESSKHKYPFECPYKFIDVNTLTRDDEVIEEVLQSYEREEVPEPKKTISYKNWFRGLSDEDTKKIFMSVEGDIDGNNDT